MLGKGSERGVPLVPRSLLLLLRLCHEGEHLLAVPDFVPPARFAASGVRVEATPFESYSWQELRNIIYGEGQPTQRSVGG